MGWEMPLSGERPWGAGPGPLLQEGRRVGPLGRLEFRNWGGKRAGPAPRPLGSPVTRPPLYPVCSEDWARSEGLQLCSLPGGGDGRGVGWGGLK